MNNKNEKDKDVDESVELTLSINNNKTNKIITTTNKKEFSARLSGLSDDCDVVNGVTTTSQDIDNDDDSKTNIVDYKIKSILPPVTNEMKEEYLLEQALKKEVQERYADKIAASSTGIVDEGVGEGSSSVSNKCFKLIFGLSLFGIPILMWLLIIGFGISVIVIGVISYKTYDPSNDPVHPPYYHDSASPSTSPLWSSP